MSQTKFTPGEWDTDTNAQVFDPKGRLVANCNSDTSIPRSERHENAELISAAPEMFEALIGAVQTINFLISSFDTPIGRRRMNEYQIEGIKEAKGLVRSYKKALAKARGENQAA